MMESLLFLGASYAVVAALLVALCVNLAGRRSLKIALITLVSVFYGLTWIGHQNTLGWPTSEQMPDQFRVLWITIDEPNKVTQDMGGIYFWVRELDEAGIPQGVPRAYHVPFTAQAAEEAQAALGKMEEGKVMNLELMNMRVPTGWPAMMALDPCSTLKKLPRQPCRRKTSNALPKPLVV